MKKLLALALAVMLTLSMGVMAFAASSDNERDDLVLQTGSISDTFKGVAVPGKDIKVPIEIIEPGVGATAYAALESAFRTAETALVAEIAKFDNNSVVAYTGPHTGAPIENGDCSFCKAYNSTLAAWKAASEDGKVILSAYNAWKAYDTDKAFKISFKATKGADYIKSYEIKKNTEGDMYVQVNFNEYYLGGMKDIAFEITVTITNLDKFNKWVSAQPKAGDFKRSQYVKFTIDNYKYGFNGSSNANKDFEIKSTSPTDYNVEANLDDKFGTTKEGSYIHFKKGSGEVYSFDYDNGDAYLEVKMDNQAVINMYMSTAAIKALTAAYPDAEMLFWNWRGNPEFDFTATVELTYDEDDMGDSPYLYKWDGTNLTEVSSADFDGDTCTFKTRTLGAYVMSDIELDAAAVAPATTADPADATEAPDDVTATTKTQNPDTGASDFVGVAVALAVVSLAAAGAVALKK